MGLYDFTLYDVIVRNSIIYKDRPAWRNADENQSTNFGHIKTAVDQMAVALHASGCKKGDRIGVLGKNCLSYFILYGAAAAVGAIIVPINWRLSADEAVYALDDTKPRLVFCDDSNPDWTEAVQQKLTVEAPFFNLQPGQGPFDELALKKEDTRFVSNNISADDGFVIIHTAAVTGNPRGALLSQNNLLCANMHLAQEMGLTSGDVHINALPLFHVAGLFMVFCAFHLGCLNVNLDKFDAPQIVQLLKGEGGAFMFTFAPMLKSILDQQGQTQTDISNLRAVMGLDAPEVIERYQKLTGGAFYSMYGQTETSMLASMGRYDAAPGAAGRPILLSSIQLMDDDDQPVDVNEVGEIAMRGPMVFKGYWGLEADTKHTFRNGWHHTGDLGRLDADGTLWYAGRKADKELIKPGGENVYPAEVEKAVLAHPEIAEVIVFGVPDPKWKEGIKAVCVRSEGAALDANGLIAFVGERIARYKKPQYVEFVTALPRKQDGSVDRQKVKEMYGGDPA